MTINVEKADVRKDVKSIFGSRRKLVVVLGMHRSGSSAITRGLMALGVDLGVDLMLPAGDNEKGFWEDLDIVKFNESLLEKANSAWHRLTPLNAVGLDGPAYSAERREAAALLASKLKPGVIFGFKDPRTAVLLPFWRCVFEDLDLDVRYVVTVRNPLASAASLNKRDGLPLAKGVALWAKHVVEAVGATAGAQRVFVAFDRLLAEPDAELHRIAVALDLPDPHGKALADYYRAFLDEGLRHNIVSPKELMRSGLASPFVQALDAFVSDLARVPAGMSGADDAQAVGSQWADRWRRIELGYAEIAPLLSYADEMDMEREVADLRARDLGIEVQEKDEALRAAHADLERLCASNASEIGKLTDAKAAAEARVKSLEHEMDALRAAHAEDRQRGEEEAALNKVTIERLRVQLTMERGAQAEWKRHFVSAAAKASALEVEVRRLDNDCAAYLASTSWRITAPLRRLKELSIEGKKRGSAPPPAAPKMPVQGGLNSVQALIAPADAAPDLGKADQGSCPISGGDETLRSLSSSSTDSPPLDFINEAAARRSGVLGSSWHVAACKGLGGLAPLTISMVTFNSSRWLAKFFDTLLVESYPKELITLLFVDNGSSDATLADIEEFARLNESKYRRIELFQRPNLGYGAGNDHAIRHTDDRYVLVTNVDVEFHGDTLQSLVSRALLDDERVACWEARQYPYEHPKYYDPVSLETAWSSHACVLMRRSAYLEVGGYDPDIFMYGEDVELSYRFRARGHLLRYVPSAGLTHHVDFERPQLRAHQLSGSLAANLLLRRRYGTPAVHHEGELLFQRALAAETDRERILQFERALTIVQRSEANFAPIKDAAPNVGFPFDGFDYAMRRDGHDVRHSRPPPKSARPLVTIVTRTYGPRTDLLRECIASVLNQTWENVEHLIVEDRTRLAEQVVAEARERYGSDLAYIRSDGAGRARAGNCGFEKARGEYLMMLDDDDLVFPDHVETLMEALLADREAVASYALAWDVQTANINEKRHEFLHSTPAGHKEGFSLPKLLDMNYIPIQAILFKKDLFRNVGGFEESLDQLEDWHLWARYAMQGRFAYTPKTTSLYRTPANPDERAKRQERLDAAYEDVHAKIHAVWMAHGRVGANGFSSLNPVRFLNGHIRP